MPEKEKDIYQNPFPHFDLVPHPLELVGRRLRQMGAILGDLVFHQYSIPERGAEPFLEAVQDAEGEQLMMDYWGEMATPETPVPMNRYPGVVGGVLTEPRD